MIAGSGMGEEIRKIKRGGRHSNSNILSNPRPVKGKEELAAVLKDACTQGNAGWAG